MRVGSFQFCEWWFCRLVLCQRRWCRFCTSLLVLFCCSLLFFLLFLFFYMGICTLMILLCRSCAFWACCWRLGRLVFRPCMSARRYYGIAVSDGVELRADNTQTHRRRRNRQNRESAMRSRDAWLSFCGCCCCFVLSLPGQVGQAVVGCVCTYSCLCFGFLSVIPSVSSSLFPLLCFLPCSSSHSSLYFTLPFHDVLAAQLSPKRASGVQYLTYCVCAAKGRNNIQRHWLYPSFTRSTDLKNKRCGRLLLFITVFFLQIT